MRIWLFKALPQFFAAAMLFLAVPVVLGQSAPPSFDLAAIHQNIGTDETVHGNVSMGNGNVYTPTGGLFQVRNAKLIAYIIFAYRMTDGQIAALRAAAPEWVKTDRFDIIARTNNTAVTKDELRLMMRSLLAERFHMKVHEEMQNQPVYNLELVHPGETGPSLRVHTDASCPSTLPPHGPNVPERPETTNDGYPSTCGGIILLPSTGTGHIVLGGRKVPIQLMADSFSGWGSLKRAVVDRTGLKGDYDFRIDYVWEGSLTNDPEASGPPFQEALKKQLGLRLESSKADVDVFVLDHIEHPEPN